jgi:sulfoxide reductase heme-binding subunit YedZ
MLRDSLNSMLEARWTKPLIFALCLAPGLVMAWSGLRFGLGTDIIQVAVRRTGEWTLKLLILTLAVTPLRRLTGLSNLIRFRRMLGLFAFFYGCLHLFAWKVMHHMPRIGQFSAWNLRLAFVAFVLMIPLAVTSTASSIQWLGGKRWRLLHSLIYASAILGYVHYCAITESSPAGPVALGGVLVSLLILRLLPIKNS